MNTSAILGVLILFGGVLLAIIFMKAKNEKEYKAAMAEYQKKVAEYNAAMEAAAAAPSAAVVSAVSVGKSEGEVKLIGVNEETAAMIIAILCDELGKDPSALTFHSITAL